MLSMLLLALLCCSMGCKSPAKTPSIDSLAERYLRLVVALGERDPDSLDFYAGPEALIADVRRQTPQETVIATEAADLRDVLSRLDQSGMSATDKRRVNFLRLQSEAVRARAQMLTGTMPGFDEEARIFFGISAGTDSKQDERVQSRRKIAELLGGSKNLAHRYSLFERQFVVAPEKVPVVMDAALRECRAATIEQIKLPAGEHVDVEYVHQKPWSGFSRYLGHAHSVIQINMDFPHTMDQMLTLACHEGYPGHHVFNTLRDQSLVERGHEAEWEAQPTFSPQSFVSEAAASYAPEMAFSPEQRLHVERDVLFPLAGLDAGKAERYLKVERLVDSLDSAEPGIAREYLDGRLEFVRAADALERETLMEHGETLLLYLNEYRSYMLTYTVGRSMVEQMIEQGQPPDAVRWQRYLALMTQPVSSLPGD